MDASLELKGANNKTDKPLEHYRERLAALDKDAISARTGLRFDETEQAFAIRYMGKLALIGFPDGSVRMEGTDEKLPPYAEILMLRILVEGNLVPPTGAFLPYADIGWGESYLKAFEGRCIGRFAHMFASANDFATVAESMGAIVAKGGDATYDFEIVNGISMRLTLWDADEEFPMSAQILFSDNTSITFTSEDAAVMGDLLLNELRAASKKVLS